MNETPAIDGLKVRSIFHPTDLSDASKVAFVHALKIALLTKSELNVLHVSPKEDIPWQQFPALRPTLARWKLIPEGSPESAVGELGLSVRKVIASSDDPVDACLDFLARHPTDLVVLSVHQHNGRMRWMERAVGKPIARAIGEMQKSGAGFAGFATWLDMTPADSDMFAVPDPSSLVVLPWKREVGWLAADIVMDGKPVAHGPRHILKQQIEKAGKLGYRMKSGVECEFFLVSPDGRSIADERDTHSKPCYDQSALMRR